jgi:L-iditol 2-dehydrogenase
MLASRLVARGRIEVTSVPIPTIGPEQVLIGMKVGAICGSDLHVVYDGFEPAELPAPAGFPGHEGVGVVVDSTSSNYLPGDRVLTLPEAVNATCFAEYQRAEARSLVKLPLGVELKRLVMAQQLGTVVFALKKFWPAAGAPCATVIGSGSIGLFFLQMLKRIGFEHVIVADPELERREVALRLGATEVVDPRTESIVEATLALTNGRGADLAIEAAGYDSARALAIASAALGGRVGLFGYPERKGDAPFPFELAFRKGLTVEMITNAQLEPGLKSFREAVTLVVDNQIQVDYLLSESVGLAEIGKAFERARDHRVLKVAIDLTSARANT